MEVQRWYKHQLSADELKQYIDEAKTEKHSRKALVGKVNPETAAKIKELCGKGAEAIILESDAVRHAYNKLNHNLEDNDMLHIADVINNAAKIELSPFEHQNKDVLLFIKDINGKITFVEEVRTKYNGQLALVTCYRQKKAGRDLTHP